MVTRIGLTQASYSFGGKTNEIGPTILRIAKQAERCKFDSFLLADHLMQYARVGGPDEPLFDSWTTLGAISSVTHRIRLGTLVSCNSFRNPGHLAKISATVDNLSGGRAVLGIGAGSLETEQLAFGFPFQGLKERVERLDEAIALILALWKGDVVNLRGRYYSASGAICRPRPVQRPHPPLIIGGNSSRILSLVAKHETGCNVTGGPDKVRGRLELLEKKCEQRGVKYDRIEKTTRINVILAKDRRAAIRKANHYKPKDMAMDYYLFNSAIGSPSEVSESLHQFKAIGVDEIIVAFPDAHDTSTLDLFADEVTPNI